MLRSYRDLLVWQKAMALTVETYRFSSGFPRSEVYGLTSKFAAQLFRCRPILRKAMEEGAGRNMSNFFAYPRVR